MIQILGLASGMLEKTDECMREGMSHDNVLSALMTAMQMSIITNTKSADEQETMLLKVCELMIADMDRVREQAIANGLIAEAELCLV